MMQMNHGMTRQSFAAIYVPNYVWTLRKVGYFNQTLFQVEGVSLTLAAKVTNKLSTSIPLKLTERGEAKLRVKYRYFNAELRFEL